MLYKQMAKESHDKVLLFLQALKDGGFAKPLEIINEALKSHKYEPFVDIKSWTNKGPDETKGPSVQGNDGTIPSSSAEEGSCMGKPRDQPDGPNHDKKVVTLHFTLCSNVVRTSLPFLPFPYSLKPGFIGISGCVP
jgi:hypothetical protein